MAPATDSSWIVVIDVLVVRRAHQVNLPEVTRNQVAVGVGQEFPDRFNVARPGVLVIQVVHIGCFDRVEAAYRRTDLFERRRELMEEWAGFLDRS